MVVVFVVASLVALLLDPLVRALQKLRLPRGVAVALVYLRFLGALAVGVVYGLPGAVLALPLLAAARGIWEFASERFMLAPCRGIPALPVEVEPLADDETPRCQEHLGSSHRLRPSEEQRS